MTRDDLDIIEARIRRRWPIIEAKAGLPRRPTDEERQRAALRARRARRREAGRAFLITACAMVALIGAVFALLSYIGG